MNEFDELNGKCERFVKDVEGVRDLCETLLTVWPELYKGGQTLAAAAERIKPVNYALTSNGAEIMSGLRELYPELQEALKTLGVIKASAQLIQKTADGMRERRPAMPKVYEKPEIRIYKENERE
jgi:hypothetical protein